MQARVEILAVGIAIVSTTGPSASATFHSCAKKDKFKAYKNRHSDNDHSQFIFSISELGFNENCD